ncbi:MAG: helix-turn-helix transcriptional regulator [Tateyamaria sp.]
MATTTDRPFASGMSRRTLVFALVLGVQTLCAVFFVSEILVSVLGLPIAPISWQVHELIEIAAALGLILGVGVGAYMLRAALRRSEHVESQLRAASGAFIELLEDKFDDWKLTPAERDVALFAIKGFSTQDIASFRDTSEGTVKAQTNAIYRKAGVTGRPQLLSLFIDDLMQGPLS